MTPSTRLPRWLAFALLATLAVLLAPSARAGHDDFEFGRQLAQNRLFDYARQVFEGILAERSASDERKDEARYGLALLKKEEAIAAAGRADVAQSEVERLFDEAARDIEDFVQKNPKNTYATQAKLDVGTIRLAFVQWARELMDDPGEIVDRGYDAEQLRRAATASVRKALEYFGALRPKEGAVDPKPIEEAASYYYVISQYYAALVEPTCTADSRTAFERAGENLDQYIMMHEGQLLAVYAMDIYGLVWWELAKCEDVDEDKKVEYYNQAMTWFQACIDTPDEGPDFMRVITSGYYHLAQVGLDAGQRRGRNFQREALTQLERMLEMHPTAAYLDNGLRAMIEWSKIECARGNSSRAVEIALQAAEMAKQGNKPYLERNANRQLNEYVSGSCGGSVGGLDPEVLQRVAEDLLQRARWTDAIRAFRSVIASAPDTSEGFLRYKWRAWERIADAYRQMKDPLGEALALEPIHDAWINRVIPRDKAPGGGPGPNLIRAGDDRRRSESAMKALAEATDSPQMQQRYREIRDSFLVDYPEHPTVNLSEFKTAIDLWDQALALKNNDQAGWKGKLDEAARHFRNVAQEDKAEQQDQAWVMLARCAVVAGDYEKAVTVADEATAFWDRADQKEREEQLPTLRQRRERARSEMPYWRADALMKLGRPEEVAKTLGEYAERFPDASTPYPASFALSHLISATLDLGDVERADRLYRTLLRRDPKFEYLSTITFKFADRYNDERKGIEERLRETKLSINDVKPQLRTAEKEFHRITASLADMKNLLTKYENALALYKENEKIRAAGGRPDQIVSPDILKAARQEEESGEIRGNIEKLQADLAKTTKLRGDLDQNMTELLAKKHELEQEIYGPLTKSISYYKAWDDTLKVLEEQEKKPYRDPANLAAFGYMCWTAGRLKPEVLENWQNARSFFEDYLEHPQIQREKVPTPERRLVSARLGDTYISLAEAEKDPEKARALVTRAVDLLQRTIANDPTDNDLVVSMLANKVLVLSDRDAETGKRWRFAVPLPSSVDDLRSAVKNIGKDDDPFKPTFSDDRAERDWADALRKFQGKLTRMDDAEIKSRLLPKDRTSPFDAVLYAQLANSSSDFRLALAWAYAHTGRDEDLPKAINLLLSFLRRGPLAAEEDSEEFWRAYGIQTRLYLDTAERWLGSPSTSADAAGMLDSAKDIFLSLAATFPTFGEETLQGNKARWQEMLERLNALRRQAGMPVVTVVTRAPAAPGRGAGGAPASANGQDR